MPASPQEPGRAADEATQVYAEHRELLFAVVYDMLGSVADTEDVLQETWLAWAARSQTADADPIEHPRGYLVRVAVRQALARRDTINRRKETYVGPWLPEPLDTSGPDPTTDVAEAAVRTETLSFALLVVLETLSPLERAVFVLHEVFGYPHTEVAGILDRSPEAVRQLARRARAHVHDRRPRYRADPRQQRQATERFFAAIAGGDLDALMRVLAPDVTLWADAGGKVPRAGLHPVRGRDKVARFLVGVATRSPDRLRVSYRQVNGEPAAVLVTDEGPFAVLVLDLATSDEHHDGEAIHQVYAVGNPDKLTRVH